MFLVENFILVKDAEKPKNTGATQKHDLVLDF